MIILLYEEMLKGFVQLCSVPLLYDSPSLPLERLLVLNVQCKGLSLEYSWTEYQSVAKNY